MKPNIFTLILLLVMGMGPLSPVQALRPTCGQLWDEFEECDNDPACDVASMMYIIEDLYSFGCV